MSDDGTRRSDPADRIYEADSDSSEEAALTAAVWRAESRLFDDASRAHREVFADERSKRPRRGSEGSQEVTDSKVSQEELAVRLKQTLSDETLRFTKNEALPNVDDVFAQVVDLEFARKGCRPSNTLGKRCKPDESDKGSSRLTSVKETPQQPQRERTYTLPDAGTWHVPLTVLDVFKSTKNKAAEAAQREAKQNRELDLEKKLVAPASSTGPPTRAASVKEREKMKRQKGQSSHSSWKSETWMKLRQQFD